ncbi:MAG: hypothetical protein QS748_02365 [Candidatus Endonucleobacter bathymodioli]|uniref:Uncharacterized protein n=1 Tax=Candidatus Endonucleibacter bathymodioli TaxID=539814 RepID=A0AA90NRT1_9GAMM|nr:hypothetical protein [Candidatus Endonucleobacter bathymodioli]
MNINEKNNRNNIPNSQSLGDNQGNDTPIKTILSEKEIPIDTNSNTVHQKPILTRDTTNHNISHPSITDAQQQIHTLTLQQSQIYSGMHLLHPLLTSHNRLTDVNGLFFQQPNGSPIMIAPMGRNLPAHLIQPFAVLQNNLINNQHRVINSLYQQMTQLQLQIQNRIQHLASMAVQAQLPPAQFRYLLPQPSMQPQPIALEYLIGCIDQPQLSLPDPWLPKPWAIQPESRVITGFPAPHSHWVAGNALLTPTPDQTGFYFQPQPPAPHMVFQNPMLPHAMWINHVNRGLAQQAHNFYRNIQYPIIYPGLVNISHQPLTQYSQPHGLLQGERPDNQLNVLQKQLSEMDQKLTILLKESHNSCNEKILNLKDEIRQLWTHLRGTIPNSSIEIELNNLKKKYDIIVKENTELHLKKAQLQKEIKEIKILLHTGLYEHTLSKAKIFKLESTLHSIRHNYSTILHENEEFQEQIANLQNLLTNLREENTFLQNTNLEKASQSLTLETQMNQMVEKLDSFKNSQEQQTAEITELQKNNLSLKKTIANTEEHNKSTTSTLQACIATLNAEKDVISTEKDSLDIQIQCIQSELQEVHTTLASAKEENKIINDQVTAIETEHKKLQHTTTEKDSKIQELNALIELHTQDQIKSDNEISDLKDTKNRLNDNLLQLTERLEIIDKLETKNKNLEMEIFSIKKHLDESNSKHTTDTADLTEKLRIQVFSNTQATSLQRKLKRNLEETRVALKKVTAENIQIVSRSTELTEKLNIAKRQLETLTQKNQKLKIQMTSLQRSIENIDDKSDTEQLEKLRTELNNLQNALSKASEENNITAQQNSSFMEEINYRKQEHHSQIEEIETLRTQQTSLTIALQQNTNQLNEYRSSLKKHEEMLDHNKDSQTRLKEANDNLKINIKELEDELTNQKEKTADQSSSIEQLKEDNNTLDNTINALQQTITSKETELEKGKDIIDKLTSDQYNAATSLKEAILDVTKNKTYLDEAKKKLDDVTSTLDTANQDYKTSSEKSKELLDKLQQTETLIKQLQSTLSDKEDIIKNYSDNNIAITAQISDQQARIDSLSKELSELHEEQENLKMQNSQYIESLEKASDDLDNITESADNLEKEISHYKTENSKNIEIHAKLESQLKTTTANLDNEKNTVQELKMQELDLNNQIENAKEDITKTEISLQNNVAECDKIKKDLDMANTSLADSSLKSQETCTALTKKIQEQEKQLHEKEADITSLKTKEISLQVKITTLNNEKKQLDNLVGQTTENISTLKKEHSELKQEKTNIENKNKELIDIIKQLHKESEASDKVRDELNEKTINIQKDLDAAIASLKESTSGHKISEQLNLELKQKTLELQQTLDNRGKSRTDLDNEIKHCKNHIEELTKQITTVGTQVQTLQTTATETKIIDEIKTQIIIAIKSDTLDDIHTAIDKITSEISKPTNTNMSEDLNALKDSAKAIAHLLKSKKTSSEEMDATIKNTAEQNNKLDSQIQHLTSKISALEKNIATYTSVIDKINSYDFKNADSCSDLISVIQKQIDFHGKKDLITKLKEINSLIEHLSTEQQGKMKELSALQKQLKEEQNKNAAIKRQIALTTPITPHESGNIDDIDQIIKNIQSQNDNMTGNVAIDTLKRELTPVIIQALNKIARTHRELVVAIQKIEHTTLPKDLTEKTVIDTENLHEHHKLCHQYLLDSSNLKQTIEQTIKDKATSASQDQMPSEKTEISNIASYLSDSVIPPLDKAISQIQKYADDYKTKLDGFEQASVTPLTLAATYKTQFSDHSKSNITSTDEFISMELSHMFSELTKSPGSITPNKSITSFKFTETSRQLLLEIAEQSKSIVSKKITIQNLHEYQVRAENLKKCAHKLRIKNLGTLGRQLPEAFKTQQNNYVDFTLNTIDKTITKTISNNKSTPKDIRLSLFDDTEHPVDVYNTVLNKVSDNDLRLTKDIMKNEDVLTDIIWMVSRQKHTVSSIEKGKSEIYCATKTNNDNNDADAQYCRSTEKMITSICSSHGLTYKPSMSAILITLLDLTLDIKSPVLSILDKRYTAQPGLTKKKDKPRALKFSNLCLGLIDKEHSISANDKLFYRGQPQDKQGLAVKSPHNEELELFAKNKNPYFEANIEANDGTQNIVNGTIKSQGLLGSYLHQSRNVKYKEITTTGEITVADESSKPVLLFKQKTKESKLSVEISGSNKTCDQTLYLTFPNYESPFKETAKNGSLHRNSLPVSDTMSTEVGELVLINNQHFYFKVIENIDNDGNFHILKCTAIGPEKDADQEILDGCIFAYAACIKKRQIKQAEYLMKQAYSAYETRHESSTNKTQNLTDFKKYLTTASANLDKYNCSWLAPIDIDNAVRILQNTTTAKATPYLATHNAYAITPDSVLILQHRANKQYRGTDIITTPLDTQRLPVDFETLQQTYFDAMADKLTHNLTSTTSMINKRKNEIIKFKSSVFPSRRAFTGTIIPVTKNAEVSRSIDSQITKMEQHIQFQKEEYIGYLEDCSRLEISLFEKLPDHLKPCNTEDAKNLLGSNCISEICTRTILAFMVAETGAHGSQVLINDMEKLLADMKQYSVNSTYATIPEVKLTANIINAENCRISCAHHTLHKRLTDISTEQLTAQDIYIRMFESTQKSTLRDYQIETTKKLAKKIQNISQQKTQEPSRTYCQFGTGYGKTTSCMFLLRQASQSNIGGIYIAPEENVANFDIEMSLYARRQNFSYNRIDIKKISEHNDKWYEDTNTLKSILRMVRGKHPSHDHTKKTPASMSTTDLAALIALHTSLSANQKDENFQLLNEIIALLTGTSASNTSNPLIIIDECDSTNNLEAIANDVGNLLDINDITPASVTDNQLKYNAAQQRVIFMSASTNTDFGLLQFTDGTDLDKIMDGSDIVNKDVNTCEQRSERYTLDSDWKLINTKTGQTRVDAAVEKAISTYNNSKDLIFCYPEYNSGNADSETLAKEGIAAFDKVSHSKKITGHLYFKDGHLYRYTKDHPIYGENTGCKLSNADKDEIYSNGGKGFITWMTETRGYTAAQHKDTAFVFCNLFDKSSATVQQTIGRDRNNDPFRHYDGSIIITKNDIENWKYDTSSSTQKTIRDKALAQWNEMESCENTIKKLENTELNKACEHKIIVSLNTSKAVKDSPIASMKESFLAALETQLILWRKNTQIKPHIEELKKYKIAEWEAIILCKQAFMYSRANNDFSKQTISFEHSAFRAKQKAEIQNLFRKEKQLIDMESKKLKIKTDTAIDKILGSLTPSPAPSTSMGSKRSNSTPNLSKDPKEELSLNQSHYANKMKKLIHTLTERSISQTSQGDCNNQDIQSNITENVSDTYAKSNMQQQLKTQLQKLADDINSENIALESCDQQALEAHKAKATCFADTASSELQTLSTNLCSLINILANDATKDNQSVRSKSRILSDPDHDSGLFQMRSIHKNIISYKNTGDFDKFSMNMKHFLQGILITLEMLKLTPVSSLSNCVNFGHICHFLDKIFHFLSTKASADTPASSDENNPYRPHVNHGTSDIVIKTQAGTPTGDLIKVNTQLGEKEKNLTGTNYQRLKFVKKDGTSALDSIVNKALSDNTSKSVQEKINDHKAVGARYNATVEKDKKIKKQIITHISETLVPSMIEKHTKIQTTMAENARKIDQKINSQSKYLIRPLPT